MFVAYDKHCNIYMDTDNIMFIQINDDEYKEIKDDADKVWKPIKEVISSMKDRQRFEVNDDGSLFYY